MEVKILLIIKLTGGSFNGNTELRSDSVFIVLSKGMSGIVRTKLRRGFELICLWACSSNLLNPEENDMIILRENEKWLKYISNEHERKFGRSEPASN